jgi:hypothetical protein
LDAAFGASDDEEDEIEENNGRWIDPTIASSSSLSSSSPPRYPVESNDSSSVAGDLFFDAGDAICNSTADPLGADRISASPPQTPRLSRPTATLLDQTPQQNSNAARTNSYDFERASYFAPPRPTMSRTASMALNGGSNGDTTIDMSGVAAGQNAESASSVSRLRFALGRFGRLVGMRVPGATYSSLNGEDDSNTSAIRRRIVGSGLGQDGVFANLNAKPERRRRRSGDDRGDDDDLVDDILPPSYEIAAADAAPPYWETTIIGGPGGFHPLAPGGAGWTPGGAHVGALEDLIVEGLPIGNFFGFAWNLLVSMSFQFIGFLLTYLLHTTHAARCGSRAGLGITLVQYGFYLRTRAAQMADGKLPDDILGPGGDITHGGGSGGVNGEPTPTAIGAWWNDAAGSSRPQSTQASSDVVHQMLTRGAHFVYRQAAEVVNQASSRNGTLADHLAHDDGTINLPSAESMSASTEWLAYILMGMGWFILLTSLLSYWRVHRWGKQLVDAAHRDNDTSSGAAADASNETSAGGEGNAPVGFLYTIRQALRNNARNGARSTRPHSAEDWIIYPGRHRRDLLNVSNDAGRRSNDVERTNISTDERRLLEDMRSVGLIN